MKVESNNNFNFQDQLNQQFYLAQSLPQRDVFSIGKWFMERVQEAINNSDLSKVSKEDFLKMIGEAYDKFVLPIDLPGPDAILDPLLKSIILNQASRLYDKLMQPKVPQLDTNPIATALPQ